MEYLSKERYDEIAAELKHLVNEVYPQDRVCRLSRVGFTNLTTGAHMEFEIVSPHEMDLGAGKISLNSPIGAALMGRQIGEIAEAQVPSGTLRLRIESITLD